MPDIQREPGICEICGKKMARFKHQGPGIADFWKCEPCESAAPAQPAAPSPVLTPSAEPDELDSLLNVIRTWMVTESGPSRMKFSHPNLKVSVTIMGYKKLILERKFEDKKNV